MVERKKETELADLSPEQQAVVNSWGRGLAVTAGAGSGKTTTLVLKCVELLSRNPEARFAAVSFTERSASDLREKLSSRLSLSGEGGALSGHWVATIHGLCGSILREYPREAGFDGEETMLSEAEAQLLWERAVDSLWSDDLPAEIQPPFDLLLARETRDSVQKLLRRTRELHGFGVLGKLNRENPTADSLALIQVATYALERFDRLKRRRGGLDFNDLESGAHRALEHEHVREAYRKRFDLVMVDEFQDTNQVQAEILLRLAKPDRSNLCVVGDPKQSIYRFRDADVAIFEDFCAKMPVRLSLTRNFRSRPGIIEYANLVCEPAFAASNMVYEALVPAREENSDFPAVARMDVQNPLDLAAWVKAEVAGGAKLDDMALLLRKVRGNAKWLKALTSAGIPIAVGSGALFWEDPRVREMVAFLKWWDNPSNGLSGAIFLRAPWMGIDDLTLDTWIHADKTWRTPFFTSGHAVAEELQPWRTRIGRPGEILSCLLVNEAVEAELGSAFLGLWHRCEELSSRGLDFRAVTAELALAVEERRRERDVPPPKNQGQLQVLTLHGSKGLEFPRVILVDLGPKGRAGDMPLLFWDRNEGGYFAGRTAEGDRDREEPIEAKWREIEKSKNLAESKRVFYVALTRARNQLLLVCPPLPEKSAAALKRAAKGEEEDPFEQDYWRGWIDCADGGIPRLTPPGPEALGGRIAEPVAPRPRPARLAPGPLKRPRHSVTEWNLLTRCPRAYEWTYIRPVVAESERGSNQKSTAFLELEYDRDELGQKELGTRVHACLENVDHEGLRAIEEEAGTDRFQAEPLIAWAERNVWMKPADLAHGRDVRTELAFELPVGKADVLVGSMDRVILTPNSAMIIDFKITREQKGPRALLDAYQSQMELYAFALRALEPALAGPNSEIRLEGSLVNISGGEVETVPVPLETPISVAAILEKASGIIDGAKGVPTPGSLCKVCAFNARCPEGRQFLDGGG